jgi:hypothetical protein
MGTTISIGEADLLLEKLYSEAIPLVACYVREGVKVMRHGVVTGLSPEVGLTVADKDSGPVMHDYLAVSLGSPTGTGCRFWYADKRELSDENRAEIVENLGAAVLTIECADGGRLQLYFSL